jgi:hypothetical protein
MSISNYAENTVLDWLLTGTTYLSLHSADPGETGANEIAGGSYARQAITFATASSGTKATNVASTFAGMPAVTVTHTCIWSAVSSGNCLFISNALSPSKTYGAGDTATCASGATVASLD